jgi:SEC-C motif-containing protein
MMNDRCPCGRDLPYENCCAPLHQGKAKAETAEQLMRSRYSAFSKGLVDYLIKTLHPAKRTESDRLSLAKTIDNTQWLKLEILETVAGMADDTEGAVEFMAYYESDNKHGAMREKSRFIKEEGDWFYVDGQQKKPVYPGRNDPCWCGSGKKFKKCHGVNL